MVLQFIVEISIFLQNWKNIAATIFFLFLLNEILKKKKENQAIKKQNTQFNGRVDLGDHHSEGQSVNCYQPTLEEREHVAYAGATIKLPGGAQQFYEMVHNRRSVRSYSTRPVDFSIIEACIRAAGTSPSGAHTEPWTFCVISDAQMKEKVRNIIEAEEYLNYTQRMHRQWVADLKPLRTNFTKQYLTDAPYLIIVFKQIYGFTTSNGEHKKQHYYNEISVAIATGILLSAIQAAGLSSLVTTPLNCGPAIRSLLERPMNEKMLVLLPVGYAAKDCKVPDLQRKKVEDILVKY